MSVSIAMPLVLAAAVACGALVRQDDQPASASPATAVTQPYTAVYPKYARTYQAPQGTAYYDPSASGLTWLRAANRQQEYPVIWSYAGPSDNGMGLALAALDPALRAQLGVSDDRGMIVTSVASGGPAGQVGLQPNDIVLSLDDRPILKSEDLMNHLKEIGDKVATLAIVRQGKPTELKVKAVTRVTLAPATPEEPDFYLGIQTTPPDATLRAHLNLPEGQGLVVNDVVADSPAQQAELKVGDVLLSFGGEPLADTQTLVEKIRATKGESAKLELVRNGKPLGIEVTPKPRPAKDETAGSNPHTALTDQTSPLIYRYLLTQPQWRGLAGAERLNQDADAAALAGWVNRQNDPAQAKLWADLLSSRAAAAEKQDQLKKLQAQIDALQASIDELRKAVDQK